MSVRSTWIVVGIAFAAFVGLLTQLPGTPVWRLFNPTITVAVAGTSGATGEPAELEIVSVLPRDAIGAILEPRFVSGEEAEAQIVAESRVIGVSVNGDHRAYSTAHLSSHEVVNDTVGGVPLVVTW